MNYYTSKSVIIDFIRESDTIRPEHNSLTKPITLRELKDILYLVIKNREDRLVEMGVHHDDWSDDYILGQATEYIDEMNENRLAKEEYNIQVARNVQLTRKKVPKEIRDLITSYIVKTPDNPTRLFRIIHGKGGKGKGKTRTNKKNKKNKKNRKH